MSDRQSKPITFDGEETYTLDEKGRVTVPRRWRDDDEAEYHLVPDGADACLRVMHRWRYDLFGEQARTLPGMDLAQYRVFMRNFHRNSMRVSPDKQGRIAIPKDYCDRLRLKGEVQMIGSGDLFEIWSKASLAERDRIDVPTYKQQTKALGI